MDKRNKANQKRNEEAEKELLRIQRQYPYLRIRVNRDSILRYKLWIEQGERCAYSTDPEQPKPMISERMLFDGSTDIDHIYPLSVSLDDSYANKVLCLRKENMEKGQRTPWQAWGETEKYRRILRGFEDLTNYPENKLRRIKDKEFDPNKDFVAAQLNDTRYICVAVRNYLAALGYGDQHLQVSRGQMTAEMRRLWELVNILPKTVESEVGTQVDSQTGEITSVPQDKKKKDRGDHRHHAIDAIVTALVDRKVFADLMRRYRYREETGTWPEAGLECPIDNLRRQAHQIVMNNVVSHAANRKVSGGLHDELPFGLGMYIEHAIPIKKLLRQPEVIRCEPDGTPGKGLDGEDRWVAHEQIRTALRTWLAQYEKVKRAKGFPPPQLPDGTEITAVDIANRCFVKRASVETALEKADNNPGQKTWVIDPQVREVLRAWLKAGNKAKDIADNPPKVVGKGGNASKASPVRSVRLANRASGMVRFGNRPQIFAKNSNHHVAIFKRRLSGSIEERKGVFVDMLEAAKRTLQQPIIRKDPSQLLALDATIDPAEWQFDMALCANDMVIWNNDDPEWLEKNHEHFGLPIYRLQKMTEGTLTFRHFSVTSTADTDNRGVLRKAPGKLHCKKIRIDSLGNYTIVE